MSCTQLSPSRKTDLQVRQSDERLLDVVLQLQDLLVRQGKVQIQLLYLSLQYVLGGPGGLSSFDGLLEHDAMLHRLLLEGVLVLLFQLSDLDLTPYLEGRLLGGKFLFTGIKMDLRTIFSASALVRCLKTSLSEDTMACSLSSLFPLRGQLSLPLRQWQ
ncbi:uncharacterized protein LOC123397962 [Hordeum vulgare subsp. vulgare]|uniref:uncharacterized protein LOC123397962 n=1 Tax=Hordeum vulgare subsp. vulgare TaxID=112509 RepID=UPI001D1A57F8|nr:uncharacterized protein LOC123397962 [Hordeum vulgare subsp. vulgare]